VDIGRGIQWKRFVLRVTATGSSTVMIRNGAECSKVVEHGVDLDHFRLTAFRHVSDAQRRGRGQCIPSRSPYRPMFAVFIIGTMLGFLGCCCGGFRSYASETNLDAVLSRETSFLTQKWSSW